MQGAKSSGKWTGGKADAATGVWLVCAGGRRTVDNNFGPEQAPETQPACGRLHLRIRPLQCDWIVHNRAEKDHRQRQPQLHQVHAAHLRAPRIKQALRWGTAYKWRYWLLGRDVAEELRVKPSEHQGTPVVLDWVPHQDLAGVPLAHWVNPWPGQPNHDQH